MRTPLRNSKTRPRRKLPRKTQQLSLNPSVAAQLCHWRWLRMARPPLQPYLRTKTSTYRHAYARQVNRSGAMALKQKLTPLIKSKMREILNRLVLTKWTRSKRRVRTMMILTQKTWSSSLRWSIALCAIWSSLFARSTASHAITAWPPTITTAHGSAVALASVTRLDLCTTCCFNWYRWSPPSLLESNTLLRT